MSQFFDSYLLTCLLCFRAIQSYNSPHSYLICCPICYRELQEMYRGATSLSCLLDLNDTLDSSGATSLSCLLDLNDTLDSSGATSLSCLLDLNDTLDSTFSHHNHLLLSHFFSTIFFLHEIKTHFCIHGNQ